MCLQVRLSPSDILAGVLAVGLASAELASHHTSFTLNNMVGASGFRVVGLTLNIRVQPLSGFSPGQQLSGCGVV